MEIKAALKRNGVTQGEFASYLGKTREGLNKALNHNKTSQSMLDSLKVFIGKKRGFNFDIIL